MIAEYEDYAIKYAQNARTASQKFLCDDCGHTQGLLVARIESPAPSKKLQGV